MTLGFVKTQVLSPFPLTGRMIFIQMGLQEKHGVSAFLWYFVHILVESQMHRDDAYIIVLLDHSHHNHLVASWQKIKLSFLQL